MTKKRNKIYKNYIKRILDFCCGLLAVVVFCWLYLILIILGIIFMRGNPFFTQERPGKNEKIFRLIKFRTMDNRRDKDGRLLPDEIRLNKYGKLLRKTSLDELPEAFNIIKGDMSVVGPRPLVPEYLTYYSEFEAHRHDVRPGLTGLAQINGRSYICWEEIFEYDIQYVNNITLKQDISIVLKTVWKFITRKNIADMSESWKGTDGRLHCLVDGEDHIIHQPLNVERDCQTMKND